MKKKKAQNLMLSSIIEVSEHLEELNDLQEDQQNYYNELNEIFDDNLSSRFVYDFFYQGLFRRVSKRLKSFSLQRKFIKSGDKL